MSTVSLPIAPPPTTAVDADLASLFSAHSEDTSTSSETVRQSVRRRLFGEVRESTRIGRYIVQGHLGSGGMGSVYRAYDSKLRRTVAIKLLHRGVEKPQSRERRRRRLLREAQGLARISHKHVVQVHDVDTHGDQLFLVMDYVEGQTLKQWLDEGRRPWREVVEIFRQAGEGLAAAHAAGLIHRDFKPSNVLLGPEAQAKVIDFGLVRVDELTTSGSGEDSTFSSHDEHDGLGEHGEGEGEGGEADLDLTAPGAVIGTLAYIAPEVFAGRPADARSDIFSFCVALFEALYGLRPFQAESRDLLICQIIDGRVQPAPSGRRVPRWLHRVCLRGLETDPARRFPSMNALLAELSPRSRIRRRLIPMAAGLLAATVASVAIAGVFGPAPTCAGAAEAAQVYTVDHAKALAARVRGSGAPDAEATWRRLDRALRGETDALAAASESLCATRAGDEPAAALAVAPEDAERCLAALRRRTSGIVDHWTAADADALARAPELSFEDPAGCLDGSLGASGEPPSAAIATELAGQLDQVELDLADGRYDAATLANDGALARAEAAAIVKIQARAWWLRGLLQSSTADPRATESLAMAQMLAGRAGDDDLAFRALLERIRALANLRDRPEEALPWIAEARSELGRRGLGGLDEALFHSAVGELVAVRGELAEGREHLEATLEIRRRLLGDDHLLVAEAENALGSILDRQGKAAEARGLYEQALAIRERVLRADHPAIAATLTNLAGVKSALGDDAGARADYERALALDTEVFGADHPRVATIHHNLGVEARRRGDLDEAITHYRSALAIRRRVLGSDHPLVGATLNALAVAHARRGDAAEAIALYREALALRERQLGADHPDVASTLGSLAAALVEAREYAEALELLDRSRGILRAQPELDRGELAWVLRLRGVALLALDQPAPAIVSLESSIELYEALGDEAGLARAGELLAEARAAARR
ncbi:MAG: serine/threonine-protein kinase [Nannocystaceae bacterium]